MHLNQNERAIIPIAAFAASGDMPKLTVSIHQALDLGLAVNPIKEILIQLYAYAGFPRSLNALGVLMTVLEQRKAQGVEDHAGEVASVFPPDKTSLELGAANQTELVGREVSGPLFEFAPEIDYFLKAHLFGDIFQRDILSWKQRELATIAALANIHGVNSQLRSHYLISANNGVTPEQLDEFIVLLRETCGEAIAANAQVVLNSVFS
jgi:4-carboxymuconolactone decarboxylase